MYFGQRVAVIIPVLNEEGAIAPVVRAIPREVADDIVVVDNGSSDGSAAAARRAGATVVSEPRRGYGSACWRGLEVIRGQPPDIVVFLDGDFSDHPEEMPRLLDPIAREQADLVIGSRVRGADPGALPPQARLGNALATALVRLLFGFRYSDLGPFRAIRFAALEQLDLRDRDFGWSIEMQVKAVLAGLRIQEVAVGYRRRVGVSKVSGTVSGALHAGWKIVATIVALRWRSSKLAGWR
ncbi:MAG: glycosyltransferase family 2 protein [Deltaproteobacteria bacterium]|nr:glycosyltransferase family 2 protein [Deltaproteobacteria bacterium]